MDGATEDHQEDLGNDIQYPIAGMRWGLDDDEAKWHRDQENCSSGPWGQPISRFDPWGQCVYFRLAGRVGRLTGGFDPIMRKGWASRRLARSARCFPSLQKTKKAGPTGQLEQHRAPTSEKDRITGRYCNVCCCPVKA
ncbi:hypothetical protein RvY_03951 [Ramazzottius varieornatus]|uniref:Uncharacterized protein n=1 Tax=Ramazzottius varieornatus TaxID=947166 RepID=A0A1D1UTG0_RAMVA|nr:hypothetical protein RvY_03951 [Ramazzottius varieornatus]